MLETGAHGLFEGVNLLAETCQHCQRAGHVQHLFRLGQSLRSIVITASVAGIRGTSGMSPYNTSKHAVIGLMRTAALECAAHGIRVNTVNPAPIETRMMRSIEEMRTSREGGQTTVEQIKQTNAARIPLKRYGDPEEVARLMLFLASDESSFCTGGVYMVDGGSSAGMV